MLDVYPNLSSLISTLHNFDSLESFDSNIKSIHLPDRTCNDEEYFTLDFSRFILLEELEIGSNSFKFINKYITNGLNHLKSLKIGINSFTSLIGDNKSYRSFHILNCIELESIEIGRYSFCDYGGGFELKNLPKLSTIKIGEIGSNSYNFFYSSFEIKGVIDIILLMNRSSTIEFH